MKKVNSFMSMGVATFLIGCGGGGGGTASVSNTSQSPSTYSVSGTVPNILFLTYENNVLSFLLKDIFSG